MLETRLAAKSPKRAEAAENLPKGAGQALGCAKNDPYSLHGFKQSTSYLNRPCQLHGQN